MDNDTILIIATLIERLEAKKNEVDALRTELETYFAKFAVNTMFQDPQGITYKIVKPKGTFTYYRDLDYVRTAKGDEKSGSLSKKEAKERGFTVD